MLFEKRLENVLRSAFKAVFVKFSKTRLFDGIGFVLGSLKKIQQSLCYMNVI